MAQIRANHGGGGSPALHKRSAERRGNPHDCQASGAAARRSSPCARGPEQASELTDCAVALPPRTNLAACARSKRSGDLARAAVCGRCLPATHPTSQRRKHPSYRIIRPSYARIATRMGRNRLRVRLERSGNRAVPKAAPPAHCTLIFAICAVQN